MKRKIGLTYVLGLFGVVVFLAVSICTMFYDWNNTEAYHEQVKKQADMEHQHKSDGETNESGEETGEWETSGEGASLIMQAPQRASRYRYIKGCPLSKKLQRKIFHICSEQDLSFEFVMAVIFQESGWDPKCISDEGQSVGLMQVQEKWHRETMDKLGCGDLKDPVQNVQVGTELLKTYCREYQEPAWALMAYNGGQAYANRMIAEGKVSEYAASVLERAAEYERSAR